MDRSRALVTPEWVRQHLDSPDVRVVDVRWFLPSTGRSGHGEYLTGHVPGSTFVDLDSELAGHGGNVGGRHPLPHPASFAQVLSAHGISRDTYVVAYDDSGGAIAGRLWWMLRQIEHERVSVLDGGLAAWRTAGYPVQAGNAPAREPATYPVIAFGAFGKAVSRDEILPAVANGAILLDARAPERFDGTVEPVDRRAGHIPGARNAPFVGNLSQAADGVAKFLPAHQLAERYKAFGVGVGADVIVMCGSGVTACHNALAMHLAGYDAPTVYVGSWSEWSATPELPIETGSGHDPIG